MNHKLIKHPGFCSFSLEYASLDWNPSFQEDAMTDLLLPLPVAAYVEAANSHDPARVAACFGTEALVRDEGRLHRGPEAIAAWAAATATRYAPVIAPLAIAHEEGRCRMRASVRGAFPGSPVTLQFHFTLAPQGISALEIAA
jgi:hypothetical protein